jgi:hypothetical protein
MCRNFRKEVRVRKGKFSEAGGGRAEVARTSPNMTRD